MNFRLEARTAVDLRSIRRGAVSSEPQAHEPAHSLSAVRSIVLRTPPLIDRLKIRPVPAAADQNALASGRRATASFLRPTFRKDILAKRSCSLIC